MISIGDFARLGRVSVRMLRHYDAIGLLPPDRVDPVTGYRSYEASQLRRLNRIVALKDLGLRLEQVRSIVDDEVSGDELRAMLRLRQAELESQIADGEHRLLRVRARLRLIDTEDDMSTQQVTVTTVPPVRGAGLGAVAASATHEDIGPVVESLYPRIFACLGPAGVHPTGPSIALYTPAPEVSEEALRISVIFPVAAETVDGLESVDIPAGEVCSLIHRGSMDSIDATYQVLSTWARAHGWTDTGVGREVYLEVPADRNEWVTEVQLYVTR